LRESGRTQGILFLQAAIPTIDLLRGNGDHEGADTLLAEALEIKSNLEAIAGESIEIDLDLD